MDTKLLSIPRDLVGSGWDEAFASTGDGIFTEFDEKLQAVVQSSWMDWPKHNPTDIRPALMSDVSLAPFTREDIAVLLGSVEGQNDGPTWIALFRLKDGRFGYVEGGCDYTGWDCQSSTVCVVANRLQDLSWDRDRILLTDAQIEEASRAC